MQSSQCTKLSYNVPFSWFARFRQVSYDSELHWCWVKHVAAPVTKPVTVKCIIST